MRIYVRVILLSEQEASPEQRSELTCAGFIWAESRPGHAVRTSLSSALLLPPPLPPLLTEMAGYERAHV